RLRRWCFPIPLAILSSNRLKVRLICLYRRPIYSSSSSNASSSCQIVTNQPHSREMSSLKPLRKGKQSFSASDCFTLTSRTLKYITERNSSRSNRGGRARATPYNAGNPRHLHLHRLHISQVQFPHEIK